MSFYSLYIKSGSYLNFDSVTRNQNVEKSTKQIFFNLFNYVCSTFFKSLWLCTLRISRTNATYTRTFKKKLKIKQFLSCDFNKLRYLTCTYEKLLLNLSSGSILWLEVNSSGSRRNNRHDRSSLLHFYFAPRFIHLSVRNYCIQVFCASWYFLHFHKLTDPCTTFHWYKIFKKW